MKLLLHVYIKMSLSFKYSPTQYMYGEKGRSNFMSKRKIWTMTDFKIIYDRYFPEQIIIIILNNLNYCNSNFLKTHRGS